MFGGGEGEGGDAPRHHILLFCKIVHIQNLFNLAAFT